MQYIIYKWYAKIFFFKFVYASAEEIDKKFYSGFGKYKKAVWLKNNKRKNENKLNIFK